MKTPLEDIDFDLQRTDRTDKTERYLMHARTFDTKALFSAPAL